MPRPALVLGLALAAAAASPAWGATINVNCPGNNLRDAISGAAPGDTLVVSGTCSNGGGPFIVDKALTLRGSAVLSPALNVTASGVTLQGLTTSGPLVNTHGIAVYGASNVVIDGCTVLNAWGNGIDLENSSRVLVMNNTVNGTTALHGIALVDSDHNQVVGNVVLNSAIEGIVLHGSSDNYVGQNDVQHHLTDGITVSNSASRRSYANLLVGNHIANQRGTTAGTGIWLNAGSDDTCVLGNDEYGALEGGITSFDSSRNLILGNRVGGNGHAGVLLWNVPDSALGVQYNQLRRNYIFNNPMNGQVLVRGASDGAIAFNVMHNPNNTIANDVGVRLESSGTLPTARYSIDHNVLYHLTVPHSITATSRDITIYRERMFNSPTNASYKGAVVKWDAQLQIGGNFYSGFAANGDPGNAPYRNFYGGGGTYQDRFPFLHENLGQPYAVSVLQPVAGVTVAAGSPQLVEWRAEACVFVDVTYLSGSGLTRAVASSYPNTGFYYGTTPADLTPGAYTVEVSCKNSQLQATGASAQSASFTVAKPDLVLLSPGWSQPIDAGSAVRVGWKKSAAVGGVTVKVSVDGGPFNTVASNVTATNYVDVTAPSTPSSRVLFKVEAGADQADTTDGYLSLRGGSPGFVGMTAGSNLLMGIVREVEWTTPPGAASVDLYLRDATNGEVVPLATGFAACHPRLSLPIPERWGIGHQLLANFRDTAGNQIGPTVASAPFNIRYTLGAGAPVPFYRLYHPVVKTHLYTTDAYEYQVLSSGGGWIGEGPVGQLMNGPANLGGVEAIPYFRLYRWPLTRHFYTTDRNEYFILRDSGQMNAEGPIGYMFPSQVAGTIPFYRARHNVYPYHLYTTDGYEYTVLTGPGGGWTGEGVIGYLYPKP